MSLTGAQAMVKALAREDIDVVFGYPGAAICPFYDALLDTTIEHVLTRNEQGAAHAASGFGRATGRTGVCIATSGPGATNLITGIATAYMDSIPLVVITGQVDSDLIGSDSFQEVDTTGATSPFTKHNYLVKSALDLPRIFREAFHLASSGRPGPVLIDVPVDVQNETIADDTPPQTLHLPGYHPDRKMTATEKETLVSLLAQSHRPIVCAGGGIISANAAGLLRRWLEQNRIPAITTMMGIGSLPADWPLYLGTMGSHGVYAANYALHHADLILILGARVGNRAMGSVSEIARRARIIHIDIDPAELGKNIRPHLAIVSDLASTLQTLLESPLDCDIEPWREKVASFKKQQMAWPPQPQEDRSIFPPHLLQELAAQAGSDAILTTEVGQNQIWAANHYRFFQPRTFLSSGGMGTMGYGLPAAMGAKRGMPHRQVISISGDGSLQMSLQELGTIRQEKLAVKIVLFNNSRLGMVHEIQSLKYNQRYSQVFLEENPDFAYLAKAYGFAYEKIEKNKESAAAIRRMLASDQPFLLECIVDPHEPTLYPLRKDDSI